MAAPGEEKQAMELNPQKEDQIRVDYQLRGGSNTESIFQVNTAPIKTWPELVGLSGEEAKGKILAENPDLIVQVMPDDSFVTMDFRTDRVRIFVDANGKVSKTPSRG